MKNIFVFDVMKNKIEKLLKDFDGVIGLSFTDIKTKHTFDINGSEIFPVASTIKIHILVQILKLVEESKLDLNKKIKITKKLLSAGSGILPHLDNEISLTLLDILNFMIHLNIQIIQI